MYIQWHIAKGLLLAGHLLMGIVYNPIGVYSTGEYLEASTAMHMMVCRQYVNRVIGIGRAHVQPGPPLAMPLGVLLTKEVWGHVPRKGTFGSHFGA